MTFKYLAFTASDVHVRPFRFMTGGDVIFVEAWILSYNRLPGWCVGVGHSTNQSNPLYGS